MVFVVKQDVELQSHDSRARLLNVSRNHHFEAERRLVCIHILVFDRKPDFEARERVTERVLVTIGDAKPFDVYATDSREIVISGAEHTAVLLESMKQLFDANAVELRRIDDVFPTICRKEDLTICRQLNVIPRSGLVPTAEAGFAGR